MKRFAALIDENTKNISIDNIIELYDISNNLNVNYTVFPEIASLDDFINNTEYFRDPDEYYAYIENNLKMFDK